MTTNRNDSDILGHMLGLLAAALFLVCLALVAGGA
jgi:hypothetical protein